MDPIGLISLQLNREDLAKITDAFLEDLAKIEEADLEARYASINKQILDELTDIRKGLKWYQFLKKRQVDKALKIIKAKQKITKDI